MSFKEDFKELYPTYKQICQDTEEDPCIHGFLIWLNSSPDMEQVIDHLRDSDIAINAWETKKQQEDMVVRV